MKIVSIILLVSSFLTSNVFAQQAFDEEFLSVKKRFSEGELDAASEPFEGLRTSDGKQEGLFPIKVTGVSTTPIVRAAENYLNSLTYPQRMRTQFAVDDPEWRRWSNVDNGLFIRRGISFKEMNSAQRTAAWQLLESSLSAKGLEKSKDIMKTDQTLRELNGGEQLYDEELYFITIMGSPSETEPWGWQLDGHHLVINYSVLGDQVVMTPTFMGGEPSVATSGKYAGNAIMQEEQNAGLTFMNSLSEAEKESATIADRKTGNNIEGEANQDNLVLDYVGLQASKLGDEKKQQLAALVNIYVSNMKDGHAKVKMAEFWEHMDETYFAWVGDISDDAVFYYRIHSPVVLIEFDHQIAIGTRHINSSGKPIRDHIHTIIRTPNGNDYGKDLLSQHLADHPH